VERSVPASSLAIQFAEPLMEPFVFRPTTLDAAALLSMLLALRVLTSDLGSRVQAAHPGE